MSVLPDTLQSPIGGETLQVVETDFDGIKLLIISGDIQGYQKAHEVIKKAMEGLSVLSRPEDYLTRQVRTTMLNQLLLHGCERDESSYRDPVLESDFKFAPQDYTYVHQFENMTRFVQVASQCILGSGRTMTVFYKKDMMEPHHEEKYDYASSVGMGATEVTYSFKDKENKNQAIYAVIVYQGTFTMD